MRTCLRLDIPVFSIPHLHALRTAEIDRIAAFIPTGARILEIGAGTGEQAAELSRRGFSVTAIEIVDSNYAADRLFPILDYDGKHIPLPDASFDIVLSSNVLEHVQQLPQMHSEICRVLKLSGFCLHVLPTHSWRFWTTLSSYPDALLYLFLSLREMLPRANPSGAELRRLARAWYRTAHFIKDRFFQRRHGERGNLLSETWLFHPNWWRKHFTENGFVIIHDEPLGIFYTGNMLIGHALSIAQRSQLAATLGSACHLFKVAPEHSQKR